MPPRLTRNTIKVRLFKISVMIHWTLGEVSSMKIFQYYMHNVGTYNSKVHSTYLQDFKLKMTIIINMSEQVIEILQHCLLFIYMQEMYLSGQSNTMYSQSQLPLHPLKIIRKLISKISLYYHECVGTSASTKTIALNLNPLPGQHTCQALYFSVSFLQAVQQQICRKCIW